MVETKLMAARLAFLLLAFASLLAFHDCSRSSVHGNELDQSVAAAAEGSKITLGPCSHRQCSTELASDDGLFRSCWCCITRSRESHPCYVTKADCVNNCPLGPPRVLAVP